MSSAAATPTASHLGKPYLEAVEHLVGRIEAAVAPYADRLQEPIRMFIAGGTCLAFYVNRRISDDIDATFSRKVALPQDLEVAYVAPDGKPRLLYFDYQYNDTLGLMHEDAYADSVPFQLGDIDPKLVEIRLFAPVDLAVSKVSRFSENDQGDILALAQAGLISEVEMRNRAEEALGGYIGNIDALKTSINLACEIIRSAQRSEISPAKPHGA